MRPERIGEVVARSYRRGTLMQREGEHAPWLSYVKSGLLAVRQSDLEGREPAIACIGHGNLLGQSGLQGQASVFTVEALTPVSVCEFPVQLLEEVCALRGPSALPGLVAQHSRLVVATLAAWSRLVRLPGLDQRLAMALQLLAEMQPARSMQLPAQGALAELLNVTRESVNRTWRVFVAQGVVRRPHHHGVELDLNRLERLLAPPEP
jgi:CRP-like cAMP-binding protein